MRKKILLIALSSFFLTGCKVIPDAFDLWNKEKAFLFLPPEILGYIFLPLVLCLLPLLFFTGAIGTVMMARQKPAGVWIVALSLGLMFLLVVVPYAFLPFLKIIGMQSYPDGLTSEFLLARIKSGTAIGITLFLPLILELWELVLIAQVTIFLVPAVLTRSFKPLLVPLASVIGWFLFYPLFYVMNYALQNIIPANLLTEAANDITKGYDFVYIFVITGPLLLGLLILLPIIVAIFLLVSGMFSGDKHEEDKTTKNQSRTSTWIPFWFPGGSRPRGQQPDESVIYGYPPNNGYLPGEPKMLPPPRRRGRGNRKGPRGSDDPNRPNGQGPVGNDDSANGGGSKRRQSIPSKRKATTKDLRHPVRGRVVITPPGPDQPQPPSETSRFTQPLPEKRDTGQPNPDAAAKVVVDSTTVSTIRVQKLPPRRKKA